MEDLELAPRCDVTRLSIIAELCAHVYTIRRPTVAPAPDHFSCERLDVDKHALTAAIYRPTSQSRLQHPVLVVRGTHLSANSDVAAEYEEQLKTEQAVLGVEALARSLPEDSFLLEISREFRQLHDRRVAQIAMETQSWSSRVVRWLSVALRDIDHNISQHIGAFSPLSSRMRRIFPRNIEFCFEAGEVLADDADIIIAGHSLGGAAAQLTGAVWGRDVVCFNSAWVGRCFFQPDRHASIPQLQALYSKSEIAHLPRVPQLEEVIVRGEICSFLYELLREHPRDWSNVFEHRTYELPGPSSRSIISMIRAHSLDAVQLGLRRGG
jgi:hypothetical protein